MASWLTVPCLVALRSEFDWVAPHRAKGADGTIGDQAHADRVSDHNPDETGAVPIHDADHLNEVHALDITTALNQPGVQLDDVVAFLVARCRSGAENRLRYIIWDHTIWEASNDWRPRPYDGADPHTGHAHFSASYTTAREADTRSWGLEKEFGMTAPTAAQNADAVAAKDIDASAGTYSLGGAVWTTLGRSAILNTLPTQITALRDDLDSRVQDVDDELDGLGASLVLVVGILQSFQADPVAESNPLYDLIRQAVRAELDASA